MLGIKIGNYHTYNDFGLILQPDWSVGLAEPKKEYIEIPGGDGVLDVSEAFGDVRYNNRELNFNFKTNVPRSELFDLVSKLNNAINGKKLKIVLDDDEEWYYIGRIHVTELNQEYNIGNININCDCEPYKYKNRITVKKIRINANGSASFVNCRKIVIPKISVSVATKLTINGIEFDYSAGEHVSGDFVFYEGENVIKSSKACDVTATYQEGSL